MNCECGSFPATAGEQRGRRPVPAASVRDAGPGRRTRNLTSHHIRGNGPDREHAFETV
jgi:hypothetical protein